MIVTSIQDLVGKFLHSFEVSGDNETLYLYVSEQDKVIHKAILACCGDCCSQSWIEAYGLSGFKTFVELRMNPLIITEIKETDLGEIEGLIGHDHLSFYKTEIKLKDDNSCINPSLVIEYRNDSNGFYGGSLNFISCELDSLPDDKK